MMIRIPAAPRLARTVLLTAVLAGLAGCGSSELHQRYTAEKMLWRAEREAQRLDLGQQVTDPKDVERALAAYDAIVKRFPPEAWKGRSSNDAKLVRQIAGEAMFARARLLTASGRGKDAARTGEARTVLAEMQRLFAGEDMALRATYLDGALRGSERKPAEAAAVFEAIPKDYAPVAEDGRTPRVDVLRAPLVAASWYLAADDTASTSKALDDARSLYESLIASRPGTPVALLARTFLFDVQTTLGLWREAADNVARLVADPIFRADDPRRENAAWWRIRAAGVMAGPLGDPDGALRELADLEREGAPPEAVPGIRLMQAQALAFAGQSAAALDTLAGVLAANPDDADLCAQTYKTRANIYEQTGEWERALEEYRTLVSRYPRSDLGLRTPRNVVFGLLAQGRRERGTEELSQAITDYRRIIESDPGSSVAVQARHYMAQTYEIGGDWTKAAGAYGDVASAAKGSPGGAQALWDQARIYATQLNKPDEARKLLDQLVREYAGTELADLATEQLARLGGGVAAKAAQAPEDGATR